MGTVVAGLRPCADALCALRTAETGTHSAFPLICCVDRELTHPVRKGAGGYVQSVLS